jgi:hypothetical protein
MNDTIFRMKLAVVSTRMIKRGDEIFKGHVLSRRCVERSFSGKAISNS